MGWLETAGLHRPGTLNIRGTLIKYVHDLNRCMGAVCRLYFVNLVPTGINRIWAERIRTDQLDVTIWLAVGDIVLYVKELHSRASRKRAETFLGMFFVERVAPPAG